MTRRIALAVLLACGTAAWAQTDDPDAWIRPGNVPARAAAFAEQAHTAEPEPEARGKLVTIRRGLDELTPRLKAFSKRIDAAIAASLPLAELGDLHRELDAATKDLEPWRRALEAEAERVGSQLEQLEAAEGVFRRTLARPETREAGAAVERRVRASLDLANETAGRLRDWRARVLTLEDEVAERSATIAIAVDRLERAAAAQRSSLLVPDRPPLWRTDFGARFREELPRVPASVGDFSARNLEYVRDDPRPLLVQGLLFVAGAVSFWRVRRGMRRALQGASGELSSLHALERPFSIALLLSLLTTLWMHPLAPRGFRQLTGLIALAPVWRIVRAASAQASPAVLSGLFALLLIDRLSLALQELPTLQQSLFLLEMVLAVALALRVHRHGGVPGEPRRVRAAALGAAILLGIALPAQIGGWTAIGTLLGHGAISVTLLAVYLWAAVAGLDALLSFAFGLPRWRGVGSRTRERMRRGLRWLAVAVWVYGALGSIGLRERVVAGLRALLDAGISVGALSLTLGGVLAFVLTILAAPLIARALDLLLERGIYPRLRLPRGLPYALSTLARYAVYALAFLVALAAAGVELTQLSILLGGLGVGVGLGLQDVVKNFAAGLTLLFERRVHVGDVVQIPSHQIYGRVREIGMRASMVRNFDGAEVVVPNGDLVSAAVTNWTLSDSLRRIELPVGVAYGSDLEQVLGLLLAVAREHADVLDQPPAQALFQGFGESSLDFLLRVWTDSDYDRTLAIRSELALATSRRLRDAGIPIPFPQRDLHLQSVSAEARAALSVKDPSTP